MLLGNEGADMDIGSLINDVIDREGGYSNQTADAGGATRWGITEAVARAEGYGGDMRRLSRAQAAAIYRRRYWAAPGLDGVAVVAPALAAELFDTGVNMGPVTAASFLQRALNALNRGARDYPDLLVDGRLGLRTAAALSAFLALRGRSGEGVLLKAVEALQGEKYLALAEARPANEAFLYGWLANRIG
jgi:lysozyme family protein